MAKRERLSDRWRRRASGTENDAVAVALYAAAGEYDTEDRGSPSPSWRRIDDNSAVPTDTLVLVRRGDDMDLTMLCRGYVWHGPTFADCREGEGWLADDGRLLPPKTWDEWMEVPR